MSNANNITFFDERKRVHKKTKSFTKHKLEFKSGNLIIKLIDTPHCSDDIKFIDNAIEYIKISYDSYENKLAENDNNNDNIDTSEHSDNRIHLVLFCLSNNIENDVLCIGRLNTLVNVIPVITTTVINKDSKDYNNNENINYSNNHNFFNNIENEVFNIKLNLINSLEKENIKIFDVYKSINVSHYSL